MRLWDLNLHGVSELRPIFFNVGSVLVKARGALKRKDLLGPRHEAQSASTRLIEVKRTFKK